MGSVPLVNSNGPDEFTRSSVLPEDVLNEAVPMELRKAENFVAVVRKILDNVKVSEKATFQSLSSTNESVGMVVKAHLQVSLAPSLCLFANPRKRCREF